MDDFFKSNPIALRYCLLYEFLQQKSIEISFSNFCKAVGNDVIEKEEFQFCFNQFEQGRFDDKSVDNIVDILHNDKQALRVCVLYEWATWKRTRVKWWTSAFLRNEALPVFTRYENFCKVIGNDVMEYRQFELWFYRFLNGEFDLNYERDKDEKLHELMDMPIDILENVVKYLDVFDRMSLARTSRSFRTFVEDQKLFLRSLNLKISQQWATLSINNSVHIDYVWEGDDCTQHHKKRETRIRNVFHWKQALLDFNSVLKYPKLHLNNLEISLELRDDHKISLDDLEDALKSPHYVNVRNLELKEKWNQLLRILPSLKPGYLTKIYVNSRCLKVFSMEKVFRMEQWKQAKYFRMDALFIWPLHHLYHFKEFTVFLMKLSVEDVRQMKETLLKSPNFKRCLIRVYCDTSANAIKEEFGDYILQEEDSSEYMKIYHYPIPDSTEYFEIKVQRWVIEITRKKA